jgi:hypothetical protein
MDFRIGVAAALIAATALVSGVAWGSSASTTTTVLACGDTPGFCPNPPTTVKEPNMRDGQIVGGSHDF